MTKFFIQLAIFFKFAAVVLSMLFLGGFAIEMMGEPTAFVGLYLFPVPFFVVVMLLAWYCQKKLQAKVL